jgi:alpha-glucosidase
MPWEPPSTAGPGAGFTTGEPWLPIGDTAEELNVASELADEGSMLTLYRRLLALRRARPSLRTGHQTFLDGPRDVLAYVRTEARERTLVLLNFRATTHRLDVTALLGAPSAPRLLASTDAARLSGAAIVLRPFSGVVLDPGSP